MPSAEEKSADPKDVNSNSEKADSVSESKSTSITTDATDSNTLSKDDDS